MQIPRNSTIQNRAPHRPEPQNKHLRRMRVLRSKSERRTILMMNLVNILVQRSPVQKAVSPVVECIFHDEEDGDLPGHGLPGGEGDVD